VVGFGSSLDSVAVGGATIERTGAFGLATNMAFSMPRDGTLVQLSAFFSLAAAVAAFPVGGTIIVEVYRSTTPDNIFSPTGVLVNLPLPAGALAAGTFASGTIAAALPLNIEDRLLLVAHLTIIDGIDVATAVVGYISAGVAIS
jgi:collagen type I alpha